METEGGGTRLPPPASSHHVGVCTRLGVYTCTHTHPPFTQSGVLWLFCELLSMCCSGGWIREAAGLCLLEGGRFHQGHYHGHHLSTGRPYLPIPYQVLSSSKCPHDSYIFFSFITGWRKNLPFFSLLVRLQKCPELVLPFTFLYHTC